MKIKHMEVVPHARKPIGNYAVIKLLGISRLNGPATFRLEPLSGPGQPPPLSWLRGDLKPISVRGGLGIVELLIGPEIVRAACLKPGTHVRFRMPSADADISIEWPDLQAKPGLFDGGSLTDKPEPAAASDTDDQAPQAPVASATVEAAPLPVVTATSTSPSNTTESQSLARLQRRPAATASPPNVKADNVAAMKPNDKVDSNPIKKTDTDYLDEVTKHLADERSKISEAAVSAPTYSDDETYATAPPIELPPPPRPSSSWVQLALGLVIVASLFVTFLRNTTVEGSSITLYSALRSAVTGTKPTNAANHAPTAVLGKILEVGTVSPSGVNAAGLTQRQALERANKLLPSMKTPADRAEVAFWLRKALSRSLSEPRLVWAVTQLGAAYASFDDDSDPNYDAAQLLWTWAANAGDAQAACFLGRLYERGLGVPPDAKLAREKYKQAHRLGGCPGLEQAMLRIEVRP